MPVKISNSFSPYTPVGEALNNALTNYTNSIPTYGEVQQGRVNANKADAPAEIGAKIRALYGSSGMAGQPLTPMMVQDQIGGLAEATAKSGDVGKLGELLRVVVANAANPESVQMIDRAQQGAGQAYGTTETGYNIGEKNDITKVRMQQEGANYRAGIAARSNANALKQAATVKGKQDLSSILADMDSKMVTLDKGGDFTDADGIVHHSAGGGITSLNNGTFKNLLASAGASQTGQFFNKKLGTTNQSLRNDLAAKLPLIKQAVMSATGMSAKQLDSNVELKTFMQALSDPNNDVQSNRETLRNLDRLFGEGSLSGGAGIDASHDTVDNSGTVVDAPGVDGAIYDDVTGKNYRLGDDGAYYEE